MATLGGWHCEHRESRWEQVEEKVGMRSGHEGELGLWGDRGTQMLGAEGHATAGFHLVGLL